MIHVVARMELNEGALDKMLAIMKDLVPVVRAEEGCIMYNPCVDNDPETAGNHLTIVEAWDSEAHLKAHLESAHMAAYRENVKDLRKNSNVRVLTPVL